MTGVSLVIARVWAKQSPAPSHIVAQKRPQDNCRVSGNAKLLDERLNITDLVGNDQGALHVNAKVELKVQNY
jgi:hypothetical protein